jgi:hypothetical protein
MAKKHMKRMKKGIPNPFNPMDPGWERPPSTPKPPPPVRKVSLTPAAKLRARSVGVSSSSRQRTNKRGPAKRKR